VISSASQLPFLRKASQIGGTAALKTVALSPGITNRSSPLSSFKIIRIAD